MHEVIIKTLITLRILTNLFLLILIDDTMFIYNLIIIIMSIWARSLTDRCQEMVEIQYGIYILCIYIYIYYI